MGNTEEFGISPHGLARIAENLVACPEFFYVTANRLHLPGKCVSQYLSFWLAEAKTKLCQYAEQSQHIELTCRKVFEIPGNYISVVHRDSVNPDKHLVASGNRFFRFLQVKDIRSSVLCIDYCFHFTVFLFLPVLHLFFYVPGHSPGSMKRLPTAEH